MELDGLYEPNEAGAADLAEAKPLYVGNDKVTAHVYGRQITIFVGLNIVFEGPLPGSITRAAQINPWIRSITAGRIVPVAVEPKQEIGLGTPCVYFAGCTREAVTTIHMGVVGAVDCCRSCANRYFEMGH